MASPIAATAATTTASTPFTARAEIIIVALTEFAALAWRKSAFARREVALAAIPASASAPASTAASAPRLIAMRTRLLVAAFIRRHRRIADIVVDCYVVFDHIADIVI